MPLQTITHIIGVAKQASKGSIAANPTFAHGLTGGKPIIVDPSQSPLETTAAKRAAYNVYRDSVKNGSEPNSMAYLKSVGLWLLGAMGSVTTTGTNPYTHTYATGDLPYLSVFSKGLGSDIMGIRDCKVDELSLKWSGKAPVELGIKAQGTVFSYPATFTATTDETGSESFLIPVGGTFQFDPIGGSVASAAVTAGEIVIKNNVSTVDTSAAIEASDVWEGLQDITLKLTIIPDDLSAFRKTVTGGASGTSVSASVPVGSVNLVFKENGSTGTLTITGSKIAFLTAVPDADPKGGAVQIELAGQAVIPSGGTAPLTFALVNAQASY